MLLSAGTLLAADQMTISVCNLGELPKSAVASAKAEVSAVFQAAKVEITWKSCDELPGNGPSPLRWFVLRLRSDKPLLTSVTSTSLDVMGRAFVAEALDCGMADAYFLAIQDFARKHKADAGTLLGYVIVHELGHLLLGPGHVAEGVMQTGWNETELNALRQRWLRFTKTQEARIHHALQTNAGASESTVDSAEK
jgi:hypothetical protein